MNCNTIEKKDFAGKSVPVLGETYEPGAPESKGVGEDAGWRRHFAGRDDMIRYLKNGERYWYSPEWYGSEKKR